MQCPFSNAWSLLIGFLAIVSAIFFYKYFANTPFFLKGLLTSAVIFAISWLIIVFPKIFDVKPSTAFHVDYIVWVFYSYTIVFGVALVIAFRYFK